MPVPQLQFCAANASAANAGWLAATHAARTRTKIRRAWWWSGRLPVVRMGFKAFFNLTIA